MNHKIHLHALWITPWYPHEAAQQEGDYIKRMALALSQECRVTIVALHEVKSSGWKLTRCEDGVEEWHFFFPQYRWLPLRFLAFTCSGLWSLWTLRRMRFDVVHAHTAYPAGHVAVGWALFFRCPLFFSEHWSGYFDPLKMGVLKQWYLRKVLAFAQMVLPVSDSLKARMIQLGIKVPFAIVPNVVDPKLFYPRMKQDCTPEIFRYLYVGNLSIHLKCVDQIILAFAELRKHCSKVRLTLVGDGPDRSILEAMIDQLHLTQECILTGEIPHEQVAEVMASHQALVLFSKVETFSCVVAEALAVGLPVIASACGGLTDALQPKDGIVLKSHSVESLKDAMLTMKENYACFFPGTKRELADAFKPKVVASEIIKLYEHSLGL